MSAVHSATTKANKRWTNRQLAETVTARFWEEEITGCKRGVRPTTLKYREAVRRYFKRLAESNLEVRAIER